MKTTLIELLKERIEKNYEDFRNDMLDLDSEAVFEMSSRIAAVKDVKFYIDNYDWVDEDEAAYLLDFIEPLVMLADAWEESLDDMGGDFRTSLESVLENEDNEENYITLAQERELQKKYGADVPARIALMSEIIEYGNKYLSSLRLYEGLGGDDWFDED